MGVIRIKQKGDFGKLQASLTNLANNELVSTEMLTYFAEKGLNALRAATPVKTGKTAACWYYTIERMPGNKVSINWSNSNMSGFVPVVILIDRGHATQSGSFVQGRHFIKNAIEPVFEEMEQYFNKEAAL